MAYLFNLWNLYQPSALVCEFDITSANLPKIKDGDAEFIESCLKALGVNAVPESWELTPIRSQYFSDYTAPNEAWEDRWYPGWTARVELRQASERLELPYSRLPVSLDAMDSTWTHDFSDPRRDTIALIVSVHLAPVDQTEQIANEILEEARRLHPLEIEPVVSVRSYKPNVQQLRFLFKNVTFPAWTATGDRIIGICRQKGGMPNFRELEL